MNERNDNKEQATWLINPDGYYPYCSNCGYEPDRPVFNKTNMTPYCPNCGERMKGDVKDNG